MMADLVSDSEVQPIKPPFKRRRILDPSAIVPVPVYSNKVSSSLQLKSQAETIAEKEPADDGAESLWLQFSPQNQSATAAVICNTEDVAVARCPSPPPPQSPVKKHSKKVKKALSDVDKTLQVLNSLLSPEHKHGARLRPFLPSTDDDVIVTNPSDDDIIVVSPDDDADVVALAPPSHNQDSPYSSQVRQIPLKIRCRTDIHKIPVLTSAPLRDVVSQLSLILDAPPPRLLLLRDDVELPTDSTIGELGIGIADIIDCVVIATEDKSEVGSITLRLQCKFRDSSLEFSLLRDAPLGSIFSQYLSSMPAGTGEVARFFFEGSKLTPSQTPAQLDMEDGDIIEVWV